MFDNYQIAHDVARFYNIIHDGVDACKHICRLVEPDSGNSLQAEQGKTVIETAQSILRSYSNAAVVNCNALYTFVQNIGIQNTKDAVTAVFVGLNVDTLITDLKTMRNVARYIYNNCLSWNETQMDSAANYIENNVPQWKSIRRRWALGG